MFREIGTADVLCITTNGFVKRNGEAVMGRGCAKQAAELWPWLPTTLGRAINEGHGNTPKYLMTVDDKTQIWSFPVKPESCYVTQNRDNVVQHMKYQFLPGQVMPGWASKAHIGMIIDSAIFFRELADSRGWVRIAMPRPGCGAGELDWWDNVRPVLLNKVGLDGRFIVYTYK